VKTSILLLDKSLARQSDTIAFFKVENDGYDLGAQRRAIQKNDLPKVQEELESYLATLRERKDPSELSLTTALIVPKEKIAANGDYNLSGDRYRESDVTHQKWQSIKLSEVCTKITDGSHNPPQRSSSGKLMLSSQNVFNNTLDLTNHRFVSDEDFEKENQRTRVEPGDVLLTIVGTIGRSLVVTEDMPAFMLQRSVAVIGPDRSKLFPAFLTRVLQSVNLQATLESLAKGVAQKGVYLNDLRNLEIPLPPLEIQKEIVAEIEGYQKVINGARAVLENYRPHIPINPDWPMVELGVICDLYQPKTITQQDLLEDGAYLVFGANGVIGRFDQYNHEEDEVLITCRGATCGTVNRSEPKSWITGNAMVAHPKDDRISKDFLFSLLKGSDLGPTISGSAQPQITRQGLAPFSIPLPPLAEQQAIVAEIEAEQALVNANRELITRFEAKIQTTLSRIWGDESSVS
jgi:type I restriction enzyme M protein